MIYLVIKYWQFQHKSGRAKNLKFISNIEPLRIYNELSKCDDQQFCMLMLFLPEETTNGNTHVSVWICDILSNALICKTRTVYKSV